MWNLLFNNFQLSFIAQLYLNSNTHTPIIILISIIFLVTDLWIHHLHSITILIHFYELRCPDIWRLEQGELNSKPLKWYAIDYYACDILRICFRLFGWLFFNDYSWPFYCMLYPLMFQITQNVYTRYCLWIKLLLVMDSLCSNPIFCSVCLLLYRLLI